MPPPQLIGLGNTTAQFSCPPPLHEDNEQLLRENMQEFDSHLRDGEWERARHTAIVGSLSDKLQSLREELAARRGVMPPNPHKAIALPSLLQPRVALSAVVSGHRHEIIFLCFLPFCFCWCRIPEKIASIVTSWGLNHGTLDLMAPADCSRHRQN